ncbi:hypothetical protein CONLIGDRAFT_635186 [Coniochaeta ligniaria NRRL 30616]|uniref:Heterokaryon incompatibility domain-containing protein n=1 Tax=Coniochaeta ligniaria NRRL 30616 TaxID=1408157 RepID=A0A1J7II59_9PEZI|nr:hypothetical protein CONLIGDRAFT_635186 [Coniochaeta ligniaria NRRL 30616]
MTSGLDKLVAIAAVAETFQRLIPIQERRRWRYLAGLWEQTLLRDLVWSPEHSGVLPARPPYRAPSWSWASVDCHVTVVAAPASFQKATTLVVHDVHVEPQSWDARFGAIVEARLTVTGMTKDISDCLVTAGGINMSFVDPDTKFMGILGLDASEPGGSSVSVTLLQVEGFKGSSDSYEMILVLRSTGRPSEYRRIGSFFPNKREIHRWSEWDASFTKRTIEII